MESQMRDIAGLLGVIQYTSDDVGYLATLCSRLVNHRPRLLLQAECDGTVLSAESFSSHLDAGVAGPLARRMAEALAGRQTCLVEVPHEGQTHAAMAMRMPEGSRGIILGCVLDGPAPAETAEGDAGIARCLCGAFAWGMLQHRAGAARLESRVRHLQAESQTLRAAHAQAVSSVMSEREERMCIQQQHMAMEEVLRATEAANRSKSEFLTNMTHEIRTPMTAILGYADVLLENLRDQECIAAAQTIRRNGESLLEILNDILDLSRIESGRLTMDRLPVSPIQLVEDVVARMQVRADAKGLPLEIARASSIPESIVTDPIRLRQILTNLLGNAIKFTETGSVRVVLRLVEPKADRPMLQFDVIDTGIGIAPEQMGRLFQTFSQGDSSISRRYGGTGLGLAISKRLAAMLGGDLRVASQPGQGSTFSLTISTGSLEGIRMLEATQPADRAKQDGTKGTIPSPTGLSCHVLLAEDGPDNQRLISLFLKKSGAQVVVASNGLEAVQHVLPTLPKASHDGQRPAPFDLVFMDIQMPVMDGYEATRQLRAGGYTGPIIALSAHSMPQDIQQCLAAGCNDYLPKPIDRDRLLETVARYAAKAVTI